MNEMGFSPPLLGSRGLLSESVAPYSCKNQSTISLSSNLIHEVNQIFVQFCCTIFFSVFCIVLKVWNTTCTNVISSHTYTYYYAIKVFIFITPGYFCENLSYSQCQMPNAFLCKKLIFKVRWMLLIQELWYGMKSLVIRSTHAKYKPPILI